MHRLLMATLLVLVGACAAHKVGQPELPVPSTLTVEDRGQILAGIARLVDLSRHKRWAAAYDQLAPCGEKPDRWPTLPEFLAEPRRYLSAIYSFRVESISEFPIDGALRIDGCGTYGVFLLWEKRATVIYACKAGSGYKFSDFIEMQGIDTGPFPCQ